MTRQLLLKLVLLIFVALSLIFITKPSELSAEFYEPILFSPNGRYLLLKNKSNDDFNLDLYDTIENKRTTIHKSTRNQISLHFSPDNEKLIFQSRNSSNLFELLLLNIADNSTIKLNAPSSLSGLPSIYWSSNSKEVAYYEVRKDETILYIDNIFDQDPPKIVTREVTLDSVLSWSPNGEELLVYSGVEGSDLLRINKGGEVISRYPQSAGSKIKEILWANSEDAYLVTLPLEAEFTRLAYINLLDGGIKTIAIEEANIEELLPLPKMNSILYHSSYRGISNAKLFNSSSNTHTLVAKLDRGSIKIQSTKNEGKSLLGIQYRFSEQPLMVEIDLQSNKINSIYNEILTQERTIPPSQVIELNHTEDPFRAFLWTPSELDYPKNGIIFVHGGPATFIGPEWSREYANFVNHGWAVFVPNYHGSSSEGEHFLKNNAPAIQIVDIISSIKFMRNRLPKNSKLFIAGQSYGSRLVIESLREVGDLIDGMILTSTIYGSPHEIPCKKRPSYIRAFHGGEDYLNSADGITSYLQQILGKDNFNINVMPEEGHILRKESSFRNIRNAILESDTSTTHKCP